MDVNKIIDTIYTKKRWTEIMTLSYEQIYAPHREQNPIIKTLLDNQSIKKAPIDSDHQIIDLSFVAQALDINIPYPSTEPFKNALYYEENAQSIVHHLLNQLDPITDECDLTDTDRANINDIIDDINEKNYALYLDQLMYPDNLVKYHMEQWVNTKNNGQLSLCQVSEHELITYVQQKFKCSHMKAFIKVHKFITTA